MVRWLPCRTLTATRGVKAGCCAQRAGTINSFNSVQAKGSTYVKQKSPLQCTWMGEGWMPCRWPSPRTEWKRGHLLSRTTTVAFLQKKVNSCHKKGSNNIWCGGIWDLRLSLAIGNLFGEAWDCHLMHLRQDAPNRACLAGIL